MAKRPGAEEFLERMQRVYEVVIYTASLAIYADPLLDEIDKKKHARYRLFREHCTFYNNAFVKDLALIGRDQKDIIIVDNSPNSYMFQPENAVPILTWLDDRNDKKLAELSPLLELMANVYDVRNAIAEVVRDDGEIDYVRAAESLKKLTGKKTALVNSWMDSSEREKDKQASTSAIIKSHEKEPPKNEASVKYINPLTPQARLKKKIIAAEEPYNSIRKLVITSKNLRVTPFSGQKQSSETYKEEFVGTTAIARSLEKRIKPGTPKPAASNALGGKNSSVGGGKPADPQEGSLPLHRRYKNSIKTGDESTRTATPKSGTPRRDSQKDPRSSISGRKTANPIHGKTALFYTNLLRSRGTLPATDQPKTGTIIRSTSNKTKPGVLSNGISSGILRGIEEAANKKLNLYNNSLDHTDWMACYEKKCNEANVNSPKAGDVPETKAFHGLRHYDKGETKMPKRLLITPVPTTHPGISRSPPLTLDFNMKAEKKRLVPLILANKANTKIFPLNPLRQSSNGKEKAKTIQRPLIAFCQKVA